MLNKICTAKILSSLWLLVFSACGALAETYAFVDVTVIPMNGDEILPHFTVVVADGRIVEVGDVSEVKPPSGAVQISGNNHFLIPGFTDAHTHLVSAKELPLYVANGVTTVFNLHGHPSHLLWRKQIAEGKLFGPTIFTTGPTFASAHTPEEAVRIVAEQAAAGYDAVKIYNQVSKEEYPALIAEAKKHDLLLMGHVARGPGFESTLAAGQSIAHAEEFTYSYFNRGKDEHGFSGIELDESRIPEVARKTRTAGISVIPTISTFRDIIRQATEIDGYLRNPQLEFLAPWVRQGLQPQSNRYQNRYSAEDLEFLQKSLLFQRKLVVALAHAGVPLLTGTDSTVIGPISGFSIHEELSELVKSGLTPVQALQAATVNAANYFGRSEEFGTIEPGKRADLILLNGNPLANIANTKKIEGVMARGLWYDRATLHEKVNAIPSEYMREFELLLSLLKSDPAKLDAYLAANDPQQMLGAAVLSEMASREEGSALHQTLLNLRKANPGSLLASEESVNMLGYNLLSHGQTEKAIEIFQANVKDFPASANAVDSLAEAYGKSGNTALAVETYRKALLLDPKYANASAAKKFVEEHTEAAKQ